MTESQNPTPLTQEIIERTKVHFDPALMHQARNQSWHAVEVITSRIRPGMSEPEATTLIEETLRELGSTKFWHRPYVRFGRNTLKGYGEPSDPGVVLGDHDIYYLDLGPVWADYEGDVGQTFVTGSNPDHLRCARDSQEIFEVAALAWRAQGLTGQALYQLAEREAARRGWLLNTEINGHRLSDFPHALYYKGSLSDQHFAPTPEIWVLEIQIRHPEQEYGAFYEDLLLG